MKSLSRLLRPDACHQHLWRCFGGQGMPGDVGSPAAEPCKAGPVLVGFRQPCMGAGEATRVWKTPSPRRSKRLLREVLHWDAAVGGSRGYGAASSFVVFFWAMNNYHLYEEIGRGKYSQAQKLTA